MKKVLIIIIAVALVFTVFKLATGNTGETQPKTIKVQDIPAELLSVKKTGIAANSFIDAFVEKVTDGDTVTVNYKGSHLKVRFLDIDTPESVKQGVPIQPYAKEASQFTKKELLNNDVKLVFSKGLRDRYSRLLAYVFLKDGTFFNAELVRNGYARVEVIPPNTLYEDYFNNLQDQAIKDKIGFWGLPAGKQPFVKSGNGYYVPKYNLSTMSTLIPYIIAG
ncbi:MAG: thermonuclease family protein [Bacillota bacterium]|nr:thermonuclease family protein [Bacillota bacterium]